MDTVNITNIKMSGGMEDSYRQDHDEFTKSNQGDSASFESEPKGQVQEVDIQALANDTKQSGFIAASESEEDAPEEEVPATQPPPAAKAAVTAAPSTNGTSNTSTDFIPNKCIPPPRNNDIDPSMFDGESASF
jgi:hypothetical protein